MGKMKAYGEWAKEKGYLDQNYTPVDSNRNETVSYTHLPLPTPPYV